MIEVDELKKAIAEQKKQKAEADERIMQSIERVHQARKAQEAIFGRPS